MNYTLIPTRYYSYSHKLPFLWQQVLRLEGDRNYTIFILINGTQYLSSKTLNVYASCLPPEFVRVHKGCVVNRRCVTGFNKEKRCILMTDGSEVKVARRRWRKVV